MKKLTFIVCAALVASFPLLSTGCSTLGSGCDTSNDRNTPVPWHDGEVEGGEYMSGPWTGQLLPFPSGQRYDLEHRLGCVPRDIGCWVSFSSTGTSQSSLAPASGNLCLLQEVNDSFIEIKNDTCSDMYVLVTASCGRSTSPEQRDASTQGQEAATP